MRIIILFLIVVSCLYGCEAKNSTSHFTRCTLAKAIVDLKYHTRTSDAAWVCLAEVVSNRDPSLITTSEGGRKFYGLYQIPQEYCEVGKNGGKCDVPCESLVTDDISVAMKCAVHIFETKGLGYWTEYTQSCTDEKIRFIKHEIRQCHNFSDKGFDDLSGETEEN